VVPDIVDGSAWVSIVAFRVEHLRVFGTPVLPPGSSFPETNLRTYVRDAAGRDGIWFLSLDVASALNVAGGRLLGVPYYPSKMSVDTDGSAIVRYRSRRLVGPVASHDIYIEPDGGRAAPDLNTAARLSGRWRAFSLVLRRLVTVRVEHEPWPLQGARLVHLDETLFEAVGLTRTDAEPIVHYADGIHARLGTPRSARNDDLRSAPDRPRQTMGDLRSARQVPNPGGKSQTAPRAVSDQPLRPVEAASDQDVHDRRPSA
jgi:hypothetical protein